jgi:dihydroflavonol-4-reductase
MAWSLGFGHWSLFIFVGHVGFMILVTGATGLLGNNVVRLLLEQGEQVRVFTREGSPTRAFEGLNVQFARGDVRDRSAVEQALQGVQAVIHSAGFVHIGWSQIDLHRAINMEGTRHVAEAAQKLQIRMVYVSAVNALGLGAKNFAADEDSALPGILECPYVITKRAAEHLVLEMTTQGLDAVVVNPGFMLGPWDWKPSSGRMMLEVAKNFMPLAPSGGFSVCDVRDVRAGVIAALKNGAVGRRYILAGWNLSYFDLWKKFAAVSGGKAPWFPAGPMQRFCIGRFGDLVYRCTGKEPDYNSAGMRLSSQQHRFSSKRAQTELGYEIRPLEETLRDAWQWFKDYGYVK